MVAKPRALNALFGTLITAEDKMLWVTDAYYDKVIFISPSFEKHTGIPCKQLYENWKNLLYVLSQFNPDNTLNKLEEKLKSRTSVNPSVVYCIYGKNQEKIYIKDSLLCLLKYKQDDKQMIVGVMELITSTEYEYMLENPNQITKNPSLDFLLKDVREVSVISNSIQEIIQNNSKKAKATYAMVNNTVIKLTRREAECLNCLLEGMSAKVIARKMRVSHRTVEVHISNLKIKTNTVSRLELISKLQDIVIIV